MKQNSIEGLSFLRGRLTVGFRRETGGVPRFETLVLESRDLTDEEIQEVSRFVRHAQLDRLEPPWVDDPIPGIG